MRCVSAGMVLDLAGPSGHQPLLQWPLMATDGILLLKRKYPPWMYCVSMPTENQSYLLTNVDCIALHQQFYHTDSTGFANVKQEHILLCLKEK